MAVRCSLGGHCKTCHIRTFLVQDFIWFDCKTCLNECKPKSSFLLSIIISTINVNLCDRNWNKIGFIGHTFIYCGTFSSYEPVHFHIVHFKRDGQKEIYKMSRFDLWATVVGKMSIDILPETYGVFSNMICDKVNANGVIKNSSIFATKSSLFNWIVKMEVKNWDRKKRNALLISLTLTLTFEPKNKSIVFMFDWIA